MPIEKITTDATTTPHALWTSVPHLQLDVDDSNYAECAGAHAGSSFVVSFGNLTSDIGSINSIRFYINGYVGVVRGQSSVCSFNLLNASDSTYSLTETKTFSETSVSTVQAGTERTTSDGSTAWTEADVNGLRMKVKLDSSTHAVAVTALDHLYINVDYNVPAGGPPTYYNVSSSYNNTHIMSGNVHVTSGNIFI